jgi:hypothetical protein
MKVRDNPHPASPGPLPSLTPRLSRSELLDLQFIEARSRLLDLAAFLDRADRHPGETDYRLEALKNALPILADGSPHRARRILEALSDPSTQPIPQAAFQGAFGAPKPSA